MLVSRVVVGGNYFGGNVNCVTLFLLEQNLVIFIGGTADLLNR